MLPLLVDENIHYRILKLLYAAMIQRWNMRAYLRYVPVFYTVWPAYKFVVTHTFWVFWPVLTYLWKGLLRPPSTILSYPKLIVWEKLCCADACDTQSTTPLSSQGTSCNYKQWS